MTLQQINRVIKQLEFLKCSPDQNKVVAAIAKSLKPNFKLTIYVEPYFTQVSLSCVYNWKRNEFIEKYKYEESNSYNHKTIALMNVLIKARNHYELQAIST